MAAGIQYYGTGRRKTATARVFLRPGNGGMIINRKPLEQAFPTEALRTQIKQPLLVTETASSGMPAFKSVASSRVTAVYWNLAGASLTRCSENSCSGR